ncbi:MAG TPA: hypothetical protein EYG51_04255 [Pseudomonadales bacterium]|nr:hypothetical protein [Candidatus Manganitrophaceae bacterium]HIL95112.1 hypothetical protein [Pseudomonadales bacterium]
MGLYDDAQIPRWEKLAKEIHLYDAKVGCQLMDPGPEGR